MCPCSAEICAAVLLGSNMPAGPDRAALIAITALITLSIATAMLRPIDGLAKLVGHRIALGRSSRERPVPAGSRGRRIAQQPEPQGSGPTVDCSCVVALSMTPGRFSPLNWPVARSIALILEPPVANALPDPVRESTVTDDGVACRPD